MAAASAAASANGSGSVVISQRAMTFDPEPTNYHLIRSEDRANVDNALMSLYRLHGDREEDDLPESLRVELIDNGNCYEVYGCGYDQVTAADLEALASSQRVISAVIRPSLGAVVVTVQSLLGIRKQHSSVVGKERYYLSQALEASTNGGPPSVASSSSSATLQFLQTPECQQLASELTY